MKTYKISESFNIINLPGGMIDSLLVMIVLGEAFGWIGDRSPIIKTFLGGGAILAIFGSAYMVNRLSKQHFKETHF